MSQLPGVSSEMAERLKKGAKSVAVESIRELRSLDRKEAFVALNRVVRGKKSIDNALNHLFGIPAFSVAEASVHHEIEKTSGKSKGKLKLSIEFQCEKAGNRRKSSNRQGGDSSYTLVLVLGSFTQRIILGDASLSVSHGSGNWTSSKEIEFDWSAANADGGEGKGQMVLRLLWEEIRGFDAEYIISIN